VKWQKEEEKCGVFGRERQLVKKFIKKYRKIIEKCVEVGYYVTVKNNE